MHQKRLDTARNTIIATLGLLISFVGLLKLTTFQITVQAHPLYAEAVYLLLTFPLQTIAVYALLVLTVVWAANYKYRESWKLTIGVMRVLQALPLGALAGISLLLAALSALAFVLIL